MARQGATARQGIGHPRTIENEVESSETMKQVVGKSEKINLKNISAQKKPFEKVRSQLETKNIIQNFLKSKEKVTLKTEGDILFYFLPKEVLEEKKVIGFVAFPDNITQDPLGSPVVRVERGPVIGNFALGKKRFFSIAYINPLDDYYYMLEFTEPLYLLQRRQHQRVRLHPSKMNAHANIVQHNGETVFWNGQILDFSKGGLLVWVPGLTAKITTLDQLKLSCHIADRWKFEVFVKIRHQKVKEDGLLFGVEFVELLSHMSNKLQMIHFELIKKMIYHFDEET